MDFIFIDYTEVSSKCLSYNLLKKYTNLFLKNARIKILFPSHVLLIKWEW